MSNSERGEIDSEQPQLPKRSWFSRLRVNVLNNLLPFYGEQKARKGDDEVVEAAIRREQRKGRSVDDVIEDSVRRAQRKGRLPQDPDPG